MPLRTLIVRSLLIGGLAFASPAQAQQAASTVCSDVPPTERARRLTRLLPGQYELTMVATAGSRRGEQRTGALHLEATRAEEGKIVLLDGVERPDTAEHPLRGHTTIDLLGVGAPMAPASDRNHPSPTSQDPTHPGVLVEMSRSAASNRVTAVTVLIGTLSNHRDGSMWLDGAGIHLDVLRADDSTFVGRWDRWGVVGNGSGYFCAARVP